MRTSAAMARSGGKHRIQVHLADLGKSEIGYDTLTMIAASASRLPIGPAAPSDFRRGHTVQHRQRVFLRRQRQPNVMSFAPRPARLQAGRDERRRTTVMAAGDDLWPPISICCTWTPSVRLASYFALAMIVAKPAFDVRSRPHADQHAARFRRVPGSGGRSSARPRPMPLASFTASAALVATPSFSGDAVRMEQASGAMSDVRPSALTCRESCGPPSCHAPLVRSLLLDRARAAQRSDLILRIAESASTSSVCSPSSGERTTSVGLSDILIGLPTGRYLPRFG